MSRWHPGNLNDGDDYPPMTLRERALKWARSIQKQEGNCPHEAPMDGESDFHAKAGIGAWYPVDCEMCLAAAALEFVDETAEFLGQGGNLEARRVAADLREGR